MTGDFGVGIVPKIHLLLSSSTYTHLHGQTYDSRGGRVGDGVGLGGQVELNPRCLCSLLDWDRFRLSLERWRRNMCGTGPKGQQGRQGLHLSAQGNRGQFSVQGPSVGIRVSPILDSITSVRGRWRNGRSSCALTLSEDRTSAVVGELQDPLD